MNVYEVCITVAELLDDDNEHIIDDGFCCEFDEELLLE